MGRHHSGQDDRTAEQYGRHSRANANGLSVGALLERAARAGHAMRLAWRGAEGEGLAQTGGEFPTAVLPVIRGTDGHQAEPDGSPGDDEDTEPSTTTREARRWLRPPGFCGGSGHWPGECEQSVGTTIKLSDGRQHYVKSLIVVDVGSTLGRFVGPGRSTTAVLASLTPPTFPRELVARTVCRVLHRASTLTEDVIREVCDELHIYRGAWPELWPASSFELYDDTVDCLARLTVLGPVAALSNLSVTGRPRMEALAQACGKYLTEIYPSYQLGACKPARWLWRYVADQHGVRSHQVIHIGDRWAEDVLGPLGVGGRAVWTRRKDVPVPGDTTALPAERWTAVDGLTAAVEVVEQWVEA